MVKKVTLFLLLLPVMAAVTAQTVSTEEAARLAKNFWYERAGQHLPADYRDMRVLSVVSGMESGHPAYYAVNLQPEGFVIVSASKAVVPVLGYAFTGSFPAGKLPDNAAAWIGGYAKRIVATMNSGQEADDGIRQEWDRLLTDDPSRLKDRRNDKSVEPMLLSTWNQGLFYNTMCPADAGGPDGHTLTGCVATAMGQILYYYRWPETGTGSYAYHHPVYGTISADFGNSTYDWDNMQHHLTTYNPGVAELLFHLGVSVDMDYGPNGSGMWNHHAALSLRTFFKCLPSTEYVWRDSTNLSWDSLVLVHLDRGQVLYYAGWSDYQYISGHAFVCDGYQGTDYFHFNWGWGGQLDGYFYLNALNPGGSNFNLVQELVVNIYPDTLQYTYPVSCQGNTTLPYLSGTLEDGSGPTGDYAPGLDCSWLIAPQVLPDDSVQNITISFQRFDTEAGQDLLTLYDGPTTASPVLGSFSGNTLPASVTSAGNQVLVVFTTNAANSGRGWILSYQSNYPEYCDNQILTEPAGTLDDGSGDKHYMNNTLCTWTIQPANAAQLDLTFTSFDLEPVKDFVEVYDLNTYALLGKYSGNTLPPVLTAPSGAMYIIFKTNGSVFSEGWSAVYSVTNLGETELSPAEAIRFFPNPVSGLLTVCVSNPGSVPVQAELVDAMGRVIAVREWKETEIRDGIDAGNLGPGLYWLRFRYGDELLTRKLVVMD